MHPNATVSTIARPTERSDRLFNLGLAFIAVIALFLTIVLKSKTVAIYKTDPIVFAYAVFITFFQLSRVLGAMMFDSTSRKTVPEELGDYRPMVSFIIPCKNEGPAIGKTVDKCFQADYPPDKLEVIVINDGSTDDTGEVLAERERIYGSRLTVVTWKINKGKRHGMAEGFNRSKGEIIVQLDSDSYIDPPTFKKLIAPFRNPVIGAVCAHADPENADANFLTKMQTAYYFVSFRILKAAESTFATVFCCSGCSSAYRKSIIMPILDEWLNETFLGLPITWGDDRALTNRVIKAGYLTVYTDKARAFTIVPEKMNVFLKQQVRWKKGWFVNSIFAAKFIVRKNPFVAFTYFLPLILVTIMTPFMAGRALVVNPFIRHISPFFYIAGVLLVSILMVLYYRSLDRSNKYWKYVFAWSGINMVFLSFILFYALATIQNRKWGTR